MAPETLVTDRLGVCPATVRELGPARTSEASARTTGPRARMCDPRGAVKSAFGSPRTPTSSPTKCRKNREHRRDPTISRTTRIVSYAITYLAGLTSFSAALASAADVTDGHDLATPGRGLGQALLEQAQRLGAADAADEGRETCQARRFEPRAGLAEAMESAHKWEPLAAACRLTVRAPADRLRLGIPRRSAGD